MPKHTFHRITDSQVGWCWQGPLGPSGTTPLQPDRPEQGAQGYGQAAIEHIQGGDHTASGSLCQYSITRKVLLPGLSTLGLSEAQDWRGKGAGWSEWRHKWVDACWRQAFLNLYERAEDGTCWWLLLQFFLCSRISAIMRETAWWNMGLGNASTLCSGILMLVENFYVHFHQCWDICSSSFTH